MPQPGRDRDEQVAAETAASERALTRDFVQRCREARRAVRERRRAIEEHAQRQVADVRRACAAIAAAPPEDQARLVEALGGWPATDGEEG
jgi:hypothetical protein